MTSETAIDLWVTAIPDSPYALCPCGCGLTWRFVVKSPEILAKHERQFIEARDGECRCLPCCHHSCTGACGCQKCRHDYADFMSAER